MVGSDPQRLRSYLVVNAVAIWSAALSFTVARLTVADRRTLLLDAAALVVAGLVVLGAQWLAERGRTEVAAGVVLLANWGVALALAWFSPLVATVAVLALLVPLLVVAEHLPGPGRSVVGALTVPLSGLVAFLGEWRRGAEDEPDTAGAVLVGVLTSLVVLVLALGLRDDVRRLGRRTRELEESRARLAGAALEARRGIERDLHDGAQQRLATLAVDLGRANRLCEDEPARAREIVHGLQSQLEEAIRELRDLAHGIYPPLLGERGLDGALPAAARRTTLPCVVETRGLRRYGPETEAAAYFCCLEAMHNADRHSGGSLITVVAVDEGDGLRFTVADDGAGFDQAAVGGSHGLTGMRDRIRAVGGELDIVSVPGEGTRVEGVFPAPHAR
jgi:signal transduction histidine kinase